MKKKEENKDMLKNDPPLMRGKKWTYLWHKEKYFEE